jgi:hypothetical protein
MKLLFKENLFLAIAKFERKKKRFLEDRKKYEERKSSIRLQIIFSLSLAQFHLSLVSILVDDEGLINVRSNISFQKVYFNKT